MVVVMIEVAEGGGDGIMAVGDLVGVVEEGGVDSRIGEGGDTTARFTNGKVFRTMEAVYTVECMEAGIAWSAARRHDWIRRAWISSITLCPLKDSMWTPTLPNTKTAGHHMHGRQSHTSPVLLVWSTQAGPQTDLVHLGHQRLDHCTALLLSEKHLPGTTISNDTRVYPDV